MDVQDLKNIYIYIYIDNNNDKKWEPISNSKMKYNNQKISNRMDLIQ